MESVYSSPCQQGDTYLEFHVHDPQVGLKVKWSTYVFQLIFFLFVFYL